MYDIFAYAKFAFILLKNTQFYLIIQLNNWPSVCLLITYQWVVGIFVNIINFIKIFLLKAQFGIFSASFLAGCQFSGRDKLSRYPAVSATLKYCDEWKVNQIILRAEFGFQCEIFSCLYQVKRVTTNLLIEAIKN